MKLLLKRVIHAERDTIGVMYIDDAFACFTLEDRANYPKIPGETRIPAGTYTLGLRHSPKFTPIYKHSMLWVMHVPEFEYILIHPGNFNRDTAGCILVGTSVDSHAEGFALRNSRLAYFDFYDKVAPAVILPGVILTIED